MSDISKIKVSGVEYGIKDIQAREDLGNLGTRVTELEQHGGGGGGSTVELDTTLSEAGKAADAKAVGDALAGKQDKLIAGDNITIAADGKTISATSGGGSSDAVLYTVQTLTDAQKKQARDNIDAAIADFVVNGTINSDMTVTTDKTFAQIQAAIQEGKQPVAKLSGPGITFYLPLTISNDTTIAFCATLNSSEYFIGFAYLALTSTGDVSIVTENSVVVDNNGRMEQVNMKFNPISDMQIATKKYVDDKECILQSTTPNSTKKFKITVDDSGTISATEVTA